MYYPNRIETSGPGVRQDIDLISEANMGGSSRYIRYSDGRTSTSKGYRLYSGERV
jgi:hypothetical protein